MKFMEVSCFSRHVWCVNCNTRSQSKKHDFKSTGVKFLESLTHSTCKVWTHWVLLCRWHGRFETASFELGTLTYARWNKCYGANIGQSIIRPIIVVVQHTGFFRGKTWIIRSNHRSPAFFFLLLSFQINFDSEWARGSGPYGLRMKTKKRRRRSNVKHGRCWNVCIYARSLTRNGFLNNQWDFVVVNCTDAIIRFHVIS